MVVVCYYHTGIGGVAQLVLDYWCGRAIPVVYGSYRVLGFGAKKYQNDEGVLVVLSNITLASSENMES